MRLSISSFIALIITLVSACAGDIKIPAPQVTVPLPPELVAAVAVAVAGNSHEEQSCPPTEPVDEAEEHPAASAADWVHLVCTDSCIVTYASPKGNPWKWFSPDGQGFKALDRFEFAGDITFPAFHGWNVSVTATAEVEIPEYTHIEVSSTNVLQYEAIKKDGSRVKKTTPSMNIPYTGENGRISLTVQRLLGPELIE